MNTQEITLDHNSDDGLYTQLLRGRYVTSVEGSIITLDDGTELHIYGNEGCGGCSSGWYWLEETFKRGNRKARIMSAYVAYSEDKSEDEPARSVYTIFVMVDGNPTQLPLATVRALTATATTAPASRSPPPSKPLQRHSPRSRPRTSSTPSQTDTHSLPSPTFVPVKTSSTLSPTRSSKREASTRLCASPDPKPSSSTS